MFDLPDLFVKNCLTALPFCERAALLHALRAGEAVRGLRLRPGVSQKKIRDILPGDYRAIPWCENAYAIEWNSRAGAHPLHEAGAYYLQEPSAMSPAVALDAKPYERVLDLCAAPGGKCTQIAGMMGGNGVIVANEMVSSRAKILSQNIERMGIPNAIVTNESPRKLAERWSGFFDRVLVDAPCSGEGMFRRDPNARAVWSHEMVAGCADRQLKILDSAAILLRDGGTLVYSTCTFNASENEEVIDRFLQKHPEFSSSPFHVPGVGDSKDGCLRLWPHRILGEGHFVAKLVKKGPAQSPALFHNCERVRVNLSKLLPEFSGMTLDGTLCKAGERFWALPDGAPDLSGIHVLRMGLALCHQRGKMIVPDHALALSLPIECFPQKAEISEKEAFQYLGGETLSGTGNHGFTVVSFEGFPLGFAKCVDGTLKNHLPKGLRKRRA